MDKHELKILVVLLLSWDIAVTSTACPQNCNCSRVCPPEYSRICHFGDSKERHWIHMSCKFVKENIKYQGNSLSVDQKVIEPQILCNINSLPDLTIISARLFPGTPKSSNEGCSNSSHISHLDLSGGNLTHYPYASSDFPKLKTLNLSSNSLGIHEVINMDAPNLRILDFSHNSFSTFGLVGSIPRLKILYLKNNRLRSFPSLHEFNALSVIDLSYNEITFGTYSTYDNCQDILPPGIETLLLRGNSIRFFPNHNCRLLDGVENLKTLDLRENSLSSFPGKYITDATTETIETLLLDENQIYHISDGAIKSFRSLKYLSLSGNKLTSLTGRVLQVMNHNFIASSRAGSMRILLENNPFDCDCDLQQSFQAYSSISHLNIKAEDVVCSSPPALKGELLQSLNQSNLLCPYVEYFEDSSYIACAEETRCHVECGIHNRDVSWLSPTGEVINTETLLNDTELNSSYSLDGSGHNLIIYDIPLSRTGVYRCISNNSFSSNTFRIEVSIIPNPIGSIVAIAVSSVSFALAIVINCFNMCKCYCEALDLEEEPDGLQETAQSPLKPSKQRGLHESEASLNANKYYKKYDFACQHVFLDAVLKGAHTVKQTLYDARNSEFSNNVWEYASHLRDRFHIELPSSVHMPRVSMPSISLPSISMPNISMPTMPNLQTINTNIERLGTSVISRSHNLASSVGSVFTLRWLKYGASDHESDSDSEQVSVSQVQVHVHQSPAKENTDEVASAASQSSLQEKDVAETEPHMQPLLCIPQQDCEIHIPQTSDPAEDLASRDSDIVTFYQFETTV